MILSVIPLRLLLFVAGLLALLAQPGARGAAQDTPIRSDRLGITFISSADHPADETRYRNALMLGAGWNRWPLYWQDIERSPGSFDWSRYDQLVANDVEHALNINGILLGIPAFYQDGASIHGLAAPAFSDGTDQPGPGKTINPANPWASFVYQAVDRYRPGGAFGAGIAVWEVWNEPDLEMFWRGSVEQYTRMLKVAYLAAHHANPEARVMFGGLAYVNPHASDWLDAVLAVIARDPLRDANGWYMDQVAVHNYSNAWRSGWIVQHARDVLSRYGLTRPIWLNESGIPVWDDYPGPTWAAQSPEQRRWRGTLQEQAAFVVQSTAYAWASGAEVVFIHQLYDDCGNQAAGTDFPPNDGGLCASGACWGDAHGLFRNDQSAICFAQSPLPGTARPAAAAFRLMAQVFGAAPFSNGSVLDLADQGTAIAFDQPAQFQRIYVLWNESRERMNVDIPASGTGATLYTLGNQDWYIEPENQEYTIGLPPVASGSAPSAEASGIGGQPFILVESVPNGLPPLNPALVELEPFEADGGQAVTTGGAGSFGLPPSERLYPTPGPLIGGAPVQVPQSPATESVPTPAPLVLPSPMPLVQPTLDPAQDLTAPVPFVIPLPIISPETFPVAWGARDNSAIASYIVWVRVNGGEWQPWLNNTSLTQAQYTGQAGNRYEFAVWAQDIAGNWSLNTELSPQAETAVQ